jgi:hypothetical protein
MSGTLGTAQGLRRQDCRAQPTPWRPPEHGMSGIFGTPEGVRRQGYRAHPTPCRLAGHGRSGLLSAPMGMAGVALSSLLMGLRRQDCRAHPTLCRLLWAWQEWRFRHSWEAAQTGSLTSWLSVVGPRARQEWHPQNSLRTAHTHGLRMIRLYETRDQPPR